MTYSALASLSGLVIPLVIATVIGMLAVPLVDALERWRVPRSIGARSRDDRDTRLGRFRL